MPSFEELEINRWINKLNPLNVLGGFLISDFNNGGNRDFAERKKFLASLSPLGRVGLATDIGEVVSFLCSEDGGWINGQRIEVSGGINL